MPVFIFFCQNFEKKGREEKFANFVDKRARVWYNRTKEKSAPARKGAEIMRKRTNDALFLGAIRGNT